MGAHVSTIKRYFWLLDLLSRQKPTLQEIEEQWMESSLNPEGRGMHRNTFLKYKKGIEELFGPTVACDSSHRYYFEGDGDLDGCVSQLQGIYTVLFDMQADMALRNRILLERVPSGERFLQDITRAMREGRLLYMEHRGFESGQVSGFNVEPYYLRLFNRCWYLIARNPYYADKGWPPMRVYALDRIQGVWIMDDKFTLDPKAFSVEDYLEGSCGVGISDTPPQLVRIKVYGGFVNYVRTLPLFDGQHEEESGEDYAIFSYHVRPGWEFYQRLFEQIDQVEVLSPEEVRDAMRLHAERLLSRYAEPKGED